MHGGAEYDLAERARVLDPLHAPNACRAGAGCVAAVGEAPERMCGACGGINAPDSVMA